MDEDVAGGAVPGTVVAERATAWNGQGLLGAIAAAFAELTTHRDAVNALNVFPVPDGDTGTNMASTLESAVEAGRALPPEAGADEVVAAVARGALLGARGNSGIILSQFLRGFADAILGRSTVDGRDLAAGLTGGGDIAYRAVLEPVEGTMLTVIRVATERAQAAAERAAAPPDVLGEAVRGARDALATTPDLLAILREAGVVDAGGQGLVHVLVGMERFARGDETAADAPAEAAPTDGPGARMAFLDRIDVLHGADGFGYCTNFVVLGEGIDHERCRAELAAMGESAVVTGDAGVLKVHLHTPHPGRVLEYALGLGELDEIKIENIQVRTRSLAAQRASASPPCPVPKSAHGRPGTSLQSPDIVGTQSVVAVAAGEGLTAALRSMGASAIVPGGQTMNPSIEELLAGVEEAPTAEVILLPNNPNIVLTANQVPALAAKRVGVVPSRSIPQGLAALATFKPEDPLERNLRRMTEALAGVRSVGVTRATRDATIDGVGVVAGQAIGLVDERLVAAGDDVLAVALTALAQAGLAEAELITVFVGEDAGPEQVAALRDALATGHPGLAVEVHDGGQPHYPFVIAVE